MDAEAQARDHAAKHLAEAELSKFFPYMKLARATIRAHFSGITEKDAAGLEIQLATSLMQQKHLQGIEAALTAQNNEGTL